MNNFESVSKIINVMLVVVPILVAIIFIFSMVLMFSPKMRAKMMGKQVKAMKYVMDDNESDLTNMATKAANITKGGVEISARALKKGFTEEEQGYCKNCGNTIDTDSKFCKKCGDKQ